MFLIALRQANVWILPTTRQAPDQTTNETVRTAAKELFDAHSRLDIDILKAAGDVGVVLPNDPSNEQQSRIVELGARTGTDHDRAFATTIRAAQGTLLVQGANIRATTRNSALRTLAHLTVHMLLRGMQTIEATGLVDPKAFQLNAKKAEVNAVRIIADNVDPADRELYVKLRQDTLWQAPISREAADRAADNRVRNVSEKVAREHTALSQKIYDLAAKAGVTLPDEPTAEQKSWANAISKSSGPELDRTYANLLRAADGSLITAVAESRASTRDNAVRDLAGSSLDLLLNQMTLLESTGLVSSDSLSAGAPAPAPKASAQSPSPVEESSNNGVLTGIIVLIVAAAGTLWLVRAVGHHGEHRR
ncbi:DUF4142 domain-containing protein [Lentzea sp. NBRC 105346]|uniref:DUF4142 domain-containing protein n=1 Tax=Lentzea sp. NBRC 105346 TaxID=3032205 RepID=UPI00255360AC|nr:DUF4142 domain-containing protein [Lentzea sp. NBRC 105346]